MALEKFEVRNHWTNAVQFTAEIATTVDMLSSLKLGLAVKWARKNGANLRGANLRGADLRFIEADYRFILSQAHSEVPALIKALREGSVNGSTYDGECACLVGTLEKAGSALPHDLENSPAEQWFFSIRKGDTPASGTEGGFRAAKALEWAESYCRDTGIALADQVSA